MVQKVCAEEEEEIEEEKGDLVSGEDAQEGFRAYMSEKERGECVHCEGFDG